MNRKIKFRYWNGVTNQMVNNPPMPYKKGWTVEQLFSDRGWVWMQFTGLTDRNGKEIYEGDILRIEHPKNGEKNCYAEVFWEQSEVRYDHEKNYAELNGYVQWGGWRHRTKHEWNYALHYDGIGGGNFEVIGNIYENPELINPN